MCDYIIVGSGLYGAIFAHEAMKAGKSCLVVESVRISVETFIQKRWKESRCISMEHIFSTQVIKRCGTTLDSLQHLTAIRTARCIL